jgi:hypothetical protein
MVRRHRSDHDQVDHRRVNVGDFQALFSRSYAQVADGFVFCCVVSGFDACPLQNPVAVAIPVPRILIPVSDLRGGAVEIPARVAALILAEKYRDRLPVSSVAGKMSGGMELDIMSRNGKERLL